jgi:hypothetical protein
MSWRRYSIRRASHVEVTAGNWKLEIDGEPVLFGTESQVRTIAADLAAAQWMLFRRAGVVSIDEGHGERVLETHGSPAEADAHARRDRRLVTELYVGQHVEDHPQEKPWRICTGGQTIKAFASRAAAMEHARFLLGSLWRTEAPAAIYAEDAEGKFRLDATVGRPRSELPELKCGANFHC